MIFGIGLPRSAGQTLQSALAILGYNTVHSPGNNLFSCLHRGELDGAVEVFAPVNYLAEKYGRDSVFILNFREHDAWLTSCQRVYPMSKDWNHPIWKYQLDQFPAYRDDYEERALHHLKKLRLRYVTWDIIGYPHWEVLCDFLGIEEPEHLFPDVDRHGRAPAQAPIPQAGNFPSPW